MQIPKNVWLTAIAFVVALAVELMPELAQFREVLSEILWIIVVALFGINVVDAARSFAGTEQGVLLKIPSGLSPDLLLAAAAIIVAIAVAIVPGLEPLQDNLMQLVLLILNLLFGQQLIRASRHLGIGVRRVMGR